MLMLYIKKWKFNKINRPAASGRRIRLRWYITPQAAGNKTPRDSISACQLDRLKLTV
jgi:hypothetical protein